MSGIDDLDGIAGLADPMRRALYRHVVAAREPVGRDAAAAAAGISRSLAAYHLDRLVDDGLLDAQYQRLSGRTGPGAGRPAKVYTRSARRFAVSVPARDYEVPARLFATAIEHDDRAAKNVARVAREYGSEIGAEVTKRCGKSASPSKAMGCLVDVLEERGYEPYEEERTIRLRNCPFDALAADHRDVVCGMNLAVMQGATDVIAGEKLKPRLDPRPGECCVALERRA
jgi:predicted ArsR family transcriptional regulator